MGIRSEWRLKAEADVQRVWQEGAAWTHPLIILRARSNNLQQTRVAFVVSKKVGNAVQRNRAKRRMREVMRVLFPEIEAGYDIVLIGRPACASATLDQIMAGLKALLTRAGLFKK